MILRGSLAPDGCVTKVAGHATPTRTYTAKVFDREEDAFAAIERKAIVAGDIIVIRYEGPKGGPGMREMLAVTGALVGAGLGDRVALVTDGRFSWRDPRPRGRSRRARGPNRRPDRLSPTATGSPSTCRGGGSISMSTRRSLRGVAPRGAPPSRAIARALAKYAKLVGSASEGAVTSA